MPRTDLLFRSLCGLAATLIALLLCCLCGQLLLSSLGLWRHTGLAFLASCDWNPVTDQYGALPPIVGTLLTGIFIQEGLISGTAEGFTVFLLHVAAVGIVFAYTFIMSMALYWLVNKMIPMRVSRQSEQIGLDVSQHGESYNFANLDDPDDRGEMKY